MKKILTIALFVVMSLTASQSYGQIFDLSTGIDNTSGLLQPILQNDDTWMVCLPGNPWNNPASYIPVQCGSGILDGYTTSYAGKDPSVRWLSPYLNAAGEHTASAPKGYYYYRMTFNNPCQVQSASMCFNHIGADNVIDQIIVNGNIHAVSYGFNPFSNNVCLTPPPAASEFLTGVNEILVRVYNSGSYTGMEINGKLTIVPVPNFMIDASFCLNITSASSLTAIPSTAGGSHRWEVYSSPNGCAGSYSNYIGTFYDPSISIYADGPCYYVKHTVIDNCGTGCSIQSGCYERCDERGGGCNLATGPKNFHQLEEEPYNLLLWDAVSGAVGYRIEVTFYDPECCHGLQPPPTPVTHTFTFVGESYDLTHLANDLGITLANCYSIRIYAICADGSLSMASDKKLCFGESLTHGGLLQGSSKGEGASKPYTNDVKAFSNSSASNTTGVDVVANGSISAFDIFPNPTKGIVSLDIQAIANTEVSISISDLNGKEVKSFKNIKSTGAKNTLVWDTNGIAKGNYVVVISTGDNKTITKKLVVE